MTLNLVFLVLQLQILGLAIALAFVLRAKPTKRRRH